MFSGRRHPNSIESVPNPEAGVPPQGRRPGSIQDIVPIGPADGIPARVEIRHHLVGGLAPYIMGEIIVQPAGERRHRAVTMCQKVHNLSPRVSPGVGPAGPTDANLFSGKPR